MSARAHQDMDWVIRQLRAKRRRVAQRKRRHRIAGAAGALAFALSTAVAVAGFTGTDLVGAATARAESLADLLDQRSPGARIGGALTKTKHRTLAERSAPPAAAPEDLAQVIAPPETAMVPVPLGAAPDLEYLSPPQTLASLVAPPQVVGSGGCCGGGGGKPGTPGGPLSPPSAPPLQTPAVPEPATWMTMLLGFGFTGWALRRNRPGVALAPAA